MGRRQGKGDYHGGSTVITNKVVRQYERPIKPEGRRYEKPELTPEEARESTKIFDDLYSGTRLITKSQKKAIVQARREAKGKPYKTAPNKPKKPRSPRPVGS